MNGYGVLDASVNKLGVAQTQAYEGTLKVAVGNADQSNAPYIKEKPSGSVAKDIFIETYVPYRTAQINLANYTVLKLLIPGDSAITAGRTIEFNLYSLSMTGEGNEKSLDPYYSGKYLVTAVRHIIQSQGAYQTVLEIAKESVKAPYATSTTETAY